MNEAIRIDYFMIPNIRINALGRAKKDQQNININC